MKKNKKSKKNQITIEKLDKQRIELRNLYIICISISIIIVIILLLSEWASLITITVLFLIYITSAITSKKKHEYNLNYKNYFVRSYLEKTFTNITYKPEKGIDESIIAETDIIRLVHRYNSNDLITGQYKNISFVQADIHIEEYRPDISSEDPWITTFKGRWMIFEFNKPFKTNVQVYQKGFGITKVNTIFSTTDYQKVEMESKEFNKNFKVYAIDPHEAFYILTPSLMEKIKKLDQMNTDELLLCFINNKLHVGIYDSEDKFEHECIFQKIDEEKVVQNISSDISKITMFVDELNLDNDLFKNSVI